MPVDHVALRANFWLTPLVRAVLALALAVVTTFTAGHSASFGLVSFGLFALLSGLALATLSARSVAQSATRSVFVVQGAVTALVGVAALSGSASGLLFYLYLVSVWAAVTGFVELYAGLRNRGHTPAARDWIIVGALTVMLAVVFLVVPPDYSQTFRAAGGVDGVVNASVVGIGVLGAYGAVVGVYLLIGALSLKWGTQQADPVPDRARERI